MSTERTSNRFAELDLWTTADIAMAIFEGQVAAAEVLQSQIEPLARAATEAAQRLEHPAGRLVYAGAGTSGRLAVLDGAELQPTFGWSQDRLVYIVAGGLDSLSRSVENAEDDEKGADGLIRSAKLGQHDVVVGVSASGTTPFTVAAIREASAAGALTVGLASTARSALLLASDHPILLNTGAELVAGSTRMKAGTAQKIALNILSTTIMIALGRVYRDLMVDMRVSNKKLRRRAIDIVAEISGVDKGEAETALDLTQNDIKIATLVAMGIGAEEAAALLAGSRGNLRTAISALRNRRPSRS